MLFISRLIAMSGNMLISIIIPAYNHERFIGAAVDSVLRQSWSDLELIVIDDGSTDRTGEIVQSYDDPRISYLYQENQDASIPLIVVWAWPGVILSPSSTPMMSTPWIACSVLSMPRKQAGGSACLPM